MKKLPRRFLTMLGISAFTFEGGGFVIVSLHALGWMQDLSVQFFCEKLDTSPERKR